MPVTSLNIPRNLLESIDTLIAAGKVRNRTQVMIEALDYFTKFQMHTWRGPLIFLRGNRHGLVSKNSLQRLVQHMTEEEQYKAGLRMGVTLRDSSFLEYRIDITRPENYKVALTILEEAGWGTFVLDQTNIVVSDSVMPSAILHGYLETALSLLLERADMSEGGTVFARVQERVEVKTSK